MAQARERLGIDHRGPLVAFLSTGGTADTRKGWDLLEAAMGKVTDALPGARCLVIGPTTPQSPAHAGPWWALPMSSVSTQDALVDIYSAATVVAVPSRQDNMPLTAMEAQACGTPVVAFATGGLPDIIKHEMTGFLAQPFSTNDLSNGIIAALTDQATEWSAASVQHAQQWSPERIGTCYTTIYAMVTGQDSPSS
jgi:glycosyltransferase involved in cell wall biosynthesis